MITVVLPTANRPGMLRTALQSIETQSARDRITTIIVSENGGNLDSRAVCAEFPALPISYVFRDGGLTALEHGSLLYAEARKLPAPYVAILHDDDWWAFDHIANGLGHLQANPTAPVYWSSSFFVQGESSWFMGCWNMSCWMVTDFGPLNELAILTLKQAALACVPSAPAAYSSLIAEKDALADAFQEATNEGNPFDNDRLLFLELARRGPVLVNLVPEVFVRLHSSQDQRSLSDTTAQKHAGAATRRILQFCKDNGIDVLKEFDRFYDQAPHDYKPYLISVFHPKVFTELKRLKALPTKLMGGPRKAKWFVRQMSPPFLWALARHIGRAILSTSRPKA